MRTLLLAALVAVVSVVGATHGQAQTRRVVWVVTLHRGDATQLWRTFRDRAAALAAVQRVDDPDVWAIVEPCEYVPEGAR